MTDTKKMVVTLTLNPALDRVIVLDGLEIFNKNIAKQVQVFPGGKGINVAAALGIQGIPVAASGFVGRNEADFYKTHLTKYGAQSNLIPVDGFTRTNIKLLDSSGRETEINEPGFQLSDENIEELLSSIQQTIQDTSFLVLSGSVALGVAPSIYAEIIRKVQPLGLKCLLDASGKALMAGMQAGPFGFKINQREMEEWMGESLPDIPSIAQALKHTCQNPICLGMVTMGGSGALIYQNDECWFAASPQIEAVNPVGAGDVMMAGLVNGLMRALPLPDLLTRATALAAASVMKIQPGVFDLETVKALEKKIHPKRVSL